MTWQGSASSPEAGEPATSPPFDAIGRRRELALRDGWQKIAVLESMSERDAARCFHQELRERDEAACREIVPLKLWQGANLAAYEKLSGGADRVRAHRLLQLIEPEERVVDIGTGHGYVSGLMLRDSPISYYCGIDISASLLAEVGRMLEANGLSGRAHHLEVRDAHDIDREFMEAHRPTLICLFEVLEHVADPERILSILGEVMGESALLLFTVPILGRLEACWGHRTVFDRPRVERMCDTAGLHIQLIEPIANTWMLVGATRTDTAPARVARHWSSLVDEGFDFRPLDLPSSLVAASSANLADPAPDTRSAGITLTAAAPGTVSASFSLPPTAVLRLEMTWRGGAPSRSLRVEASNSQALLAEWVVDAGSLDRSRTIVFRPGRDYGAHCRAVASVRPEPPHQFSEICLEFSASDRTGSLVLSRAARVPDGRGASPLTIRRSGPQISVAQAAARRWRRLAAGYRAKAAIRAAWTRARDLAGSSGVRHSNATVGSNEGERRSQP